MQQCPDCGRVYDESEYTHCPYCGGEPGHAESLDYESKLPWYDKYEERERWVSASDYMADPDRYEEP